MNQIKQWLVNREVADRSRPPKLKLNSNTSIEISDQGGLKLTLPCNDLNAISLGKGASDVRFLSYDEGAYLREWLNRIYGNGA